MSRLLTSLKRHMKFMQINLGTWIAKLFPCTKMFWKSLVLVVNTNSYHPHPTVSFLQLVCSLAAGRGRGNDIWKTLSVLPLSGVMSCHDGYASFAPQKYWFCVAKPLDGKIVEHLINFTDIVLRKSFHVFQISNKTNCELICNGIWLKTTQEFSSWIKMARSYSIRP